MYQIRHSDWIHRSKNLLSLFLESRSYTDRYSSFSRYILPCCLCSVLGAFLTGTKFWNHNLSSVCKVGVVDLGVPLVPDTGIDDSIVERCSRRCTHWHQNSSSRWKPCQMSSDEEPFGKKKLHFSNEMLLKKKLLSGPVFSIHHLHGEKNCFRNFSVSKIIIFLIFVLQLRQNLLLYHNFSFRNQWDQSRPEPYFFSVSS